MKIKTAFPYGVLIMLIAAAASGQVKPRVVDLGKQYDNQPLKVIGCQVGRLSFADCSRIEADNDWWQQLKFIVKNVSQKTVSYYEMSISIGKQGKMQYGRGMLLFLERGPTPLLDTAGKPTGRFGIMIEPGEVVFFAPREWEPAAVGNDLKKEGVTDLTRVGVDIRMAYFTDSSTWFHGSEGRLKAGQTDDLTRKLLTYQALAKIEPVAIMGIRANGLFVASSEPFISNDPDWLKDLSLTFQNKSERTIKSVSFALIIREGHPMSLPVVVRSRYGTNWFSKEEEPTITATIAPEQIGVAKMESEHYDSLRKSLPAWLAEQTTADIRLEQIVFTDGIAWESGCYHNPDPAKSGSWLSDCLK